VRTHTRAESREQRAEIREESTESNTRTHTRFLSQPGRGGVEVVCDIKTVKLGTSSFKQEYRIREVLSNVVWATADAVLVSWDVEVQCITEHHIPVTTQHHIAESQHLTAAVDAIT
jgi:hypothetical protein